MQMRMVPESVTGYGLRRENEWIKMRTKASV